MFYLLTSLAIKAIGAKPTTWRNIIKMSALPLGIDALELLFILVEKFLLLVS